MLNTLRGGLKMDVRRWGILLSAMLFLCVAQSAPAAPATILVMGDSLSAGYRINVEHGWVALLTKRLAEQGYEYNVVNASVSGETSGGGKVRLPALLSTHKPAIMILELGANDGLRGLPQEQLRSNLDTMIVAAQQAKAKVLVVGIQLPRNYGQYTEGFAAVFTDVARSHKLPLLPFLLEGVALDTTLMQPDNLHPNELAQPRLLENVWAKLRPLLKK